MCHKVWHISVAQLVMGEAALWISFAEVEHRPLKLTGFFLVFGFFLFFGCLEFCGCPEFFVIPKVFWCL